MKLVLNGSGKAIPFVSLEMGKDKLLVGNPPGEHRSGFHKLAIAVSAKLPVTKVLSDPGKSFCFAQSTLQQQQWQHQQSFKRKMAYETAVMEHVCGWS